MFVAPCAANQWTCFNRQCVNENATCDAKTDCNDGSDETYTHARCGGKNTQGWFTERLQNRKLSSRSLKWVSNSLVDFWDRGYVPPPLPNFLYVLAVSEKNNRIIGCPPILGASIPSLGNPRSATSVAYKAKTRSHFAFAVHPTIAIVMYEGTLYKSRMKKKTSH